MLHFQDLRQVFIMSLHHPQRSMLNVGCGAHFHPSWTNVDFSSTSPGVIQHDLRTTLPFADASFDTVYSSHVLEHFCRREALDLLLESKRVLKPNGTLRIVVPDLENACRSYLAQLESARNHPENLPRLEWSVVELLDQVGRRQSGGEMLEMIQSPAPSAKDFIIERVGEIEYANMAGTRETARNLQDQPSATPVSASTALRRGTRISQRVVRKILEGGALLLLRLARGSAAKAAIASGLFLQLGENHRWMYDDVQLGELLARAGFSAVEKTTFNSSRIEGFEEYRLDDIDGKERKPHSLYMEAIA